MAKFDWIPYYEGKYLTYYQWFGLLGSTGAIVLALLSFILYVTLSKIQFHHKKYRYLSWIGQKTPIIEKFKSIFFMGGFVLLSWVPMICQALEIIGLIEGILGQVMILIIGVYLDNGRKLWNNQSMLLENNINTGNGTWVPMVKQYIMCCLKLTKIAKKRIIICVITATLANLFIYRTCLCFFDSEIFYYNGSLGFGVNTCVMRMLMMKESCPVGGPCQMYTTIPQNPSEAIFLNLHTHVDVKSVDVYYQELLTPNVTDFKKVTADFFPYEGLERLARRNVHSALISGLKPSTKYLTKVFYNNRFWTNAIFKTLPAPGDKKTPIRMINAGDSGYNQAAVNLSKIVAKLQPDIFFMGGDIAYDDNMPACAYTWDYFFGMYGKITATLGYMMPIVASVGNHDVGLNQLPGVNITVSNKGPAFHIYFPQHYEQNLDGHIIEKVPALEKRRTMFNFTFGNVHYVALDSGYLHGFDGYQKKFMIDSFEANKQKIKFVNYHVPIYSICEAFDKDPTRFLYALFHWVPQFDKYHVMASFENHVHSFKRTKALVGSNPTQFGTVYMGDGAYGAIIKQMCEPDATMQIFAAYAQRNNFWLTEITQNKVQHWAYDDLGVVIDNFIQYPENYTMGTIRGELKSEQSYEITIEKAKQIVQGYYLENTQMLIKEKLPYLEQKIREQQAKKLKDQKAKAQQQKIIQQIISEEQSQQFISEKINKQKSVDQTTTVIETIEQNQQASTQQSIIIADQTKVQTEIKAQTISDEQQIINQQKINIPQKIQQEQLPFQDLNTIIIADY